MDNVHGHQENSISFILNASIVKCQDYYYEEEQSGSGSGDGSGSGSGDYEYTGGTTEEETTTTTTTTTTATTTTTPAVMSTTSQLQQVSCCSPQQLGEIIHLILQLLIIEGIIAGPGHTSAAPLVSTPDPS